MEKSFITEKVPKAIGPYSQAVNSGEFLFISGQIPIKAADRSLNHVVKTTIFTTALGQVDKINRAYQEYFPEDPSARVCVEVARLPQDVMIEIEAIAVY